MTTIRHVVFSGRVQGVGFRAHVEDMAARTVVGGWVRNRRDGTVEAIFAGDAKAENFYKLAGFKPVPLSATDILPMLQTGVIDAFDAPPLYALSGQFFGIAKYMSDIHWAPLVGATLVSKKTWERIPVELRPKLLEAARVAGQKFNTDIRGLSDQAVVEMEKRGLVVVKTTDAERAGWQREAEGIWPRLRGPYVPPELFDEVRRVRDEFRAGPKTAAPGPPK
jgi:TRAP-type C4-dicarboxylate transport system substrate-binding protein